MEDGIQRKRKLIRGDKETNNFQTVQNSLLSTHKALAQAEMFNDEAVFRKVKKEALKLKKAADAFYYRIKDELAIDMANARTK